MQSSFKGGIVGAIGALVLLGGGTAVAGTGIGGVFNLGETNTVNESTVLSGSKSGPMLRVINSSTGASASGLNINVNPSRPPIVTNSATRVGNLNADKVDGYHANQLARVSGQAAINSFGRETGRTVLQTVVVSAPYAGFVYLSGSATSYFEFGCVECAVHLRVHDVEANTDTGASAAYFSNLDYDVTPLAMSSALSVSAGTHTYELIGSWHDVKATGVDPDFWFDPSLTAIFIPFNGAGTTTPFPPPAAPASPAPAE